jgi:hypothetical protein
LGFLDSHFQLYITRFRLYSVLLNQKRLHKCDNSNNYSPYWHRNTQYWFCRSVFNQKCDEMHVFIFASDIHTCLCTFSFDDYKTFPHCFNVSFYIVMRSFLLLLRLLLPKKMDHFRLKRRRQSCVQVDWQLTMGIS